MKNPAMAVGEDAGTRATRSLVSTAKASPSQNKLRESAQKAHIEEDVGGGEVPTSHVSIAEASALKSKLSRPAQPEQVKKHGKGKENVSRSRRRQLLYQPKDEITLLQICIKLKEVIGWGDINGFWNMVQDTVQLKTGKPYKKVSRHVRLLVQKRRVEQKEIEKRGVLSTSRVSAGCRPLLDKWIAGGKRIGHVSPSISNTPILDEDEDGDDESLNEEGVQQLDFGDSELEVQKRSATDAWLDTSCDTARSKKPKLCTSEVSYDTSKTPAGGVGCWSLSGSSVTSESSVEDEIENDAKNDMKNGVW